MAQNTTVALTAATWTLLTNSDVTSITFQVLGLGSILVKATTDTSAPTDATGALRYRSGQGERNVAMTDLFPGLSGADRLWAYSDVAGGKVIVSHA